MQSMTHKNWFARLCFLAAALLLAACASVTPTAVVPTAPVGPPTTAPATAQPTGPATPAAVTGTPGGGVPPSGPIATLNPALGSPTPATTPIFEGTPFGPDTTATPGAGSATAAPGSTPQTAVPGGYNPGAAGQAQFLKLTDLLKWKVTTAGGAPAGQVNGLMVEHPMLAEESSATPVPGAAAPTPTPLATTGTEGIFARYLLVNVAGTAAAVKSGGNQVLVPWQALALPPGASTGAVALNSRVTGLAAAPHFTLVDLATGTTPWVVPVNNYWAAQGITLPTPGSATQPGGMVLIPSEYRGINLTDAKDAAVGVANDFLLDPSTGEMRYVIFDGGSMFNERVFVIPLKNLIWNNGVGTQPGDLKFNFPSDTLAGAPSFNSLNQVALDPASMNALNQFWQSMK